MYYIAYTILLTVFSLLVWYSWNRFHMVEILNKYFLMKKNLVLESFSITVRLPQILKAGMKLTRTFSAVTQGCYEVNWQWKEILQNPNIILSLKPKWLQHDPVEQCIDFQLLLLLCFTYLWFQVSSIFRKVWGQIQIYSSHKSKKEGLDVYTQRINT